MNLDIWSNILREKIHITNVNLFKQTNNKGHIFVFQLFRYFGHHLDTNFELKTKRRMDNFNTEFLLENYLTIGNELYREHDHNWKPAKCSQSSID